MLPTCDAGARPIPARGAIGAPRRDGPRTTELPISASKPWVASSKARYSATKGIWTIAFEDCESSPCGNCGPPLQALKRKYSSTPSAMPLNPRAHLPRKTSLSYPFASSGGCLGARGRRRVETTRPALRRPRVSVFVRRELCWRAKCDTFVDLVRDWPNCGLPIPYPAAMKCSRCGHGVSNEGIPINLPPDGSRYREGRQYAQQGTKGRDCRQAAPGQRKT